jgi:serine/threonine protein kinase
LNPNLWKITDFGISAIARSRNLLATNAKRGTPQYTAPEILHSQPNTPSYRNAVDVWGLGLIVYELFTGERVFQTESDALLYPPRIPQMFYYKHRAVSSPYPLLPELSTATRIVSTPLDHPDNLSRNHIAILWKAVESMKRTDKTLLGPVNNFTIQSRLDEINKLVSVMLHLDSIRRPAIDVLEHHFRVNLVRSMVENDVVCQTTLRI